MKETHMPHSQNGNFSPKYENSGIPEIFAQKNPVLKDRIEMLQGKVSIIIPD